jgi:alkylated DNA repair dioxygenase AlkB
MGDGMRETGISVQELEAVATKMNALQEGCAEVVYLSKTLPEDLRTEHEAAVLVIRDGARLIQQTCGDMPADAAGAGTNKADALYEEQTAKVVYDRKYFDNRRSRTLNKRARFNVVFGAEDRVASDDYKEYTVVAFNRLPHLDAFRKALPSVLGEHGNGLNAEGNHYYESKSGIGFHGDAERKIVVCLSLGKGSTLRYHWREPGSSEHKSSLGPIDIQVNHGDVYIMSEKATGFDWKHRSKYRLVHAAGASKYIERK